MEIGKIEFGPAYLEGTNTNTQQAVYELNNSDNPWSMQAELMNISAQEIPVEYSMNNTSVLYAALILEEVSELLEGMTKVLSRTQSQYDLVNQISDAQRDNYLHSIKLRALLVRNDDFYIRLLREEAIELADATTDITVVNCGFAVASGIDGAACYLDVAGSNLSKANPKSGIIDKDDSGKWLKGTAYKAPNLAEVLYGKDM